MKTTITIPDHGMTVLKGCPLLDINEHVTVRHIAGQFHVMFTALLGPPPAPEEWFCALAGIKPPNDAFQIVATYSRPNGDINIWTTAGDVTA